MADSYVTAASRGSDAQQAADRKSQKYGELSVAYEFQPVAIETHGTMDDDTVCFLSDLGREIFERSGDLLDGHFFISTDNDDTSNHC